MNTKKSNFLVIITLILITLLAGGLRLYKIADNPPSISWDEAAVGYNGWTIANYGRDEWGESFPITFTSFKDDKHPVHIYITAFFIKLFGLSEFSIRLPVALFGVFNVLLMFLLVQVLFKNKLLSLISAFFLAVSPYAIQFSRFNHELNFTIFFFLLSLLLFFKGLENKKLIPLSFLSFGLTMLSYHSAKVVVPPIVLLLIFFYFKQLWKVKKYFLGGVVVLTLFVLLIGFNPKLLGLARASQTAFSKEEIQETDLYKKTGNEFLGRLNIVTSQYFDHFGFKYLFISGNENPRFSTQKVGEFYKIDGLFLLVGLAALLYKRNKIGLFIIAWALLGPLPSSLAKESPHASRAMFMMGSWHIIAAVGAYTLLNLLKNFKLRVLLAVILISTIGFQFWPYLTHYFKVYPKQYAIEWQYGMAQIADYVKTHPEYEKVYMTDIRSQPYIFYLFHLKTPLPEFLKDVKYNETQSASYNTVSSFGRYNFGNWDPIESKPESKVLYVVGPSHYDGLRYKDQFEIKKIVRFPDRSPAFYLVSTLY